MAGEAFELSSSSSVGWANGTSTDVVVLKLVQFNYAWVLLLVFVVAFVANAIISVEAPASETDEPVLLGPGGKPLPRSAKKAKLEREKRKEQLDFSPVRKLVFLYLSIGLLGTFVANGANIVVHALTESENGWWCGKATAIYVCASAFFYSIFLISLVDSTPSPNIAHQITWILAAMAEIVILAASFSIYTSPHKEINSVFDNNDIIYRSPNEWEIFELTVDVVRLVILIFSVTFYAIFSLERMYKVSTNRGDLDETAPLLVNGLANGNGHVPSNGTLPMNGNGPNGGNIAELSVDGDNTNAPGSRDSLDDTPAFYKPKEVPQRTWWEYLKGYSLFFPYLWPSKSVRLQVIVVICFLIVVCQRAVNLAVPLQIGKVVKDLGDAVKSEHHSMPWFDISLLIGLKFLQGTSGILGAVRSILWIPISQYSYQALTTASFEHVHGLSLDFHLGKRTGEVISALSKGNSINNFLEQITFQVVPMVVDLGVAIVYFGIKFDAYYALIVGIITFSYLYLTIRMARWRSVQRRAMTNLSREEDAVKNDSLTSYETVKYFNAEEYEFDRYRQAVVAFQNMEYKVTVSLNVLNISQNMVFMTGLLATSFISAYQVTTGVREVQDFVTLLTYMAQLQQPLNFFGSFYRSVQSAMISGERLLELFKEQATVVDEPGAKPVHSCEGSIRFQNVKFAYDERKPALQDLSFFCRPGTTTAFVGESGGGKSTVFRLLFRFYNAQDGSIQLDGHDVKDITIDSLRRHIGVVPQDTVLFNETLMYNLKYANQDATDEEVYEACRAASIHEKIMGFPDGYQTKVGERGLRLSGGEKQRVAIARTIIKNPRIIMLDEATAALDSETEQNIQTALTTLSEGRTMLVIAHRLSTITTADQILVLNAGSVEESGTHEELLEKRGRYYNMWRKQIRAEEELAKAATLIKKAEKLQQSGGESPPSESSSENDVDMGSSATFVPPILTIPGVTMASIGAGCASQASESTAEPYRDAASTLSVEDSGDEPLIENAAEDFPSRYRPAPGSSEEESPLGTKPGSPPAVQGSSEEGSPFGTKLGSQSHT